MGTSIIDIQHRKGILWSTVRIYSVIKLKLLLLKKVFWWEMVNSV